MLYRLSYPGPEQWAIVVKRKPKQAKSKLLKKVVFFSRAFAANENLRFSLPYEFSGGAGGYPREISDPSGCKMVKDGEFLKRKLKLFLRGSGGEKIIFSP